MELQGVPQEVRMSEVKCIWQAYEVRLAHRVLTKQQ
jgi:hypothetical protein